MRGNKPLTGNGDMQIKAAVMTLQPMFEFYEVLFLVSLTGHEDHHTVHIYFHNFAT